MVKLYKINVSCSQKYSNESGSYIMKTEDNLKEEEIRWLVAREMVNSSDFVFTKNMEEIKKNYKIKVVEIEFKQNEPILIDYCIN